MTWMRKKFHLFEGRTRLSIHTPFWSVLFWFSCFLTVSAFAFWFWLFLVPTTHPCMWSGLCGCFFPHNLFPTSNVDGIKIHSSVVSGHHIIILRYLTRYWLLTQMSLCHFRFLVSAYTIVFYDFIIRFFIVISIRASSSLSPILCLY